MLHLDVTQMLRISTIAIHVAIEAKSPFTGILVIQFHITQVSWRSTQITEIKIRWNSALVNKHRLAGNFDNKRLHSSRSLELSQVLEKLFLGTLQFS